MSLLTRKNQMRQRCSLKTVVVISSWLLESMSLLIGKTEGSNDVAENADEKLPNRAWPNVYQSSRGLMIFMKIVLASVGSGVQNLMYSFLFLMISTMLSGCYVPMPSVGVRPARIDYQERCTHDIVQTYISVSTADLIRGIASVHTQSRRFA